MRTINAFLNLPLKWLSMLFLSLTLSACGGGGGGDSDTSSVSIADIEVLDSQTLVEVTVTLSQASTETVSVDYATTDGTALAGQDYTATSGTLQFPAGTTSLEIEVPLIETRDTSTTKTFTVTLSNPVNTTISDSQATVTLLDALHSSMFNNPTYSSAWSVTGVFTNALTCAACHTGSAAVTPAVMMYDDGTSITDVSPATQWKHSVMAHSLNDPYFNAVVEEEVHIFPDKKVFIEDTCLRCHAPMASTHAHQTLTGLVDDPTGLLPDGGYPFSTAITEPHAREGISCTSCHQIQDPTTGSGTAEKNLLASMSGHYSIKSVTDNNGVLPSIFGPFQSPMGQAMQNQAKYIPEYAAHIHESAMCATCHNLYTPTLDLNGEPHLVDGKLAQFPEQTPYWDWLNSQYSDPATGKTCQACHMAQPEPGYTTPITTTPTNATIRPSGIDSPGTVFSVHEFVGGNSYLLGLLSKYMVELGISDKTTTAGFDQKIAQSKAMLASAADLNISSSLAGSTLSVPVTITNLTGHRLPTSFPSRRMWVHITVTDTGSGTTIFESGKVDAKGFLAKDEDFINYKCMSIEKTDATFDYSSCYEVHHDTINDASMTQIYEPVLGDLNGDITHVLLHADTYLKDNRIPPIGWTLADRHPNPVTPGQFDDDVIGTATTDANFATGKETVGGSDGKDTVTYNVDTTGYSGPYSISVELLYQTIRPSFVYGMHADDVEHGGIDDDSYVRRFKYMYDETPPTPEVLATANTTLTP